jgi:hypothetical protein
MKNVIVLALLLSGCAAPQVTLNVGGTVNQITIIKAAGGDITSGNVEGTQPNTNEGKLDATATP